MYNFLDALELCAKSNNWYGALFISLTLPDICAKIEYPLEKKSSSKRYIDWYDRYLKKYYEVSRNAIPLPAHLERLTALVPPHIGGGRKKSVFCLVLIFMPYDAHTYMKVPMKSPLKEKEKH